MKTFAERLVWARTQKDISQEELGKRVGVSQSTIGNYEAGLRLNPRKINSLAEALEVSAKWLEEGIGSPKGQSAAVISLASESALHKKGKTVAIKQYLEAGGAMGNGLILRDMPGEIQAWNVSPEWVNKNIKNHTGIQNLCIVTGFGNSMQPLFNPGDPLIVDTGIKVVDADATYFFRVGNEGFIKILQRIPGEGIRVISKNKDYETWTIKPDMDFEVFGQVLKAWCGTDV